MPVNQKRKAKVSRRPGMSSSSPAGFIKNLHPRASGSIFNKKPDIPSRLPCGKGFLFSVFFWEMLLFFFQMKVPRSEMNL
jgi:hypothetical protein